MSSAVLTEAELDAYVEARCYNSFAFGCAPPPETTVSQCADDHVILGGRTAEPGPHDSSRVPFQQGIMNIYGDPDIDLVVVKKASQTTASHSARMALHYWVRNDPGDCLWVFPDEKSVKKTIKKHIKPLVEQSLSLYLSGRSNDISEEKGVAFLNMDLTPAWSGSPQALASDPYRYVVLDEVDKYPEFSGKDGDPISLAIARTRTYTYRKKILIISTPTTDEGMIARWYKSVSDKRKFWVPCLECGEHQTLDWHQMWWPDAEEGEDKAHHADRIVREQSARYVCKHCDAHLDNLDRQEMVEQGEWRSCLKDTSKSREVALHISSLYTPWVNISELACKFLKACIKGINAKMEFFNQELGEEFKQVEVSTKRSTVEEKKGAGHKRGIVPAWAGAVIATADTQKDGHPYVVRAVGRNYRTRLIDFGHADSMAMLKDLTLERHYQVEDSPEIIQPRLLLIDSGGGILDDRDQSSTDKVYKFSLTDERIIPVKGHGGRAAAKKPVVRSRITYEPPDAPEDAYEVTLYILDSEYYKDCLVSDIADKDKAKWEVCDDIDENYIRQMASEHKIRIKVKGKAQPILRWMPVTEHAANHFWDCEYMARAGADLIGAATLPTEDELIRERELIEEERRRMDSGRSGNRVSKYLREGRTGFVTRR